MADAALPDSEPTRTSASMSFSICIPSYNRSQKLEALLDTIAHEVTASKGDVTVEVVIALDGSTDGSEAMLEAKKTTYPVPLRWQWHENRGRSAARNTLIDEAQNDFLWFLDDDMLLEPGVFDRHRHWDRDVAPVMFGPSYVIGGNEGLALFYEYRWRDLAERDAITEAGVVSFANTSMPTSIARANRFDESFVGYGFEDYELALRMLAAGVGFGFDLEAKVMHHNDKSGFQMLANIRDEGRNRVLLSDIHPEAGAFALELRGGRLARLLRPIADRGWSKPLWWVAHVVRAAALPLKGKRAFRVIRIADDFALYSGLASASRES